MTLIDKSHWHVCKICGKKINDLAKELGGSGIYYAQVFRRHIRMCHQDITLENYFTRYCNLSRPICECGICNQPVYIAGSNAFRWRRYACGRNTGVQKWAEKAKVSRCGINNPMFQKHAWNHGLTKEDNKSLLSISIKLSGKKKNEQHKQKLSEAAKQRIIHGHTGHTHSKETIEKLRQHTLQMIKDGRYPHTNTTPHKRLQQILNELNIDFEVEKRVGDWSFDIYLPGYDIYIEVDGDYFHSNPIFFPNGPQTKTQMVNWYRDKKKDAYCIKYHMMLWRLWEYDILNNPTLIKDRLNAIDAS